MSIDTSKIKAGDGEPLARDLDNTKKVLVELIQFLYNDKELGKDTVEFLRKDLWEETPKLERDPMCDAEWEHLLKTAQRGRIMEVDGLKMQLIKANDLLRQWRKLYDLGIEDFMPSFAHPVVRELYDGTVEYLNDINPKELPKPTITMKELEETNKAVEELTKPPSEKAPEVSDTLEWLTEYEFNWCWTTDDINLRSRLNALLTRKLREGKLPVVSKEDVEYIYSEGKNDPYSREFMLQRLADLLEGGAE